MLIDSHCHPQFPQYDHDREEVIKKTLEQEVQMICVGTDLETSKKAIELAQRYKGIWATVGLHPNDNLNEDFDAEIYKKLAKEEKVVAIGEIGLDYYRTTKEEDRKRQKERFKKQFSMTLELNMPLVLHCREAYGDMLEIIENSAQLRGVVHSFTSDWETAKKFIDLGFFIGLNGIITFTDQYNDVVKNISLDNLLLETDAPYLSPVPERGKRNEPWKVKFVAEKIASIKNMNMAEIEKITTQNTVNLFNL